MKVQVLSHYDQIEMVNVCDLRRLIASGEILAFRRSSGWVKVGSDKIRGDGGEEYDGPERRNFKQKALSIEQIRSKYHSVLAVTGSDPDS